MTEARAAMWIALRQGNEEVLCKSESTQQMTSDTITTDQSLHFQMGFDLHIIILTLLWNMN